MVGEGRTEYSDDGEEGEGTVKKIDVASVYVADVVEGEGVGEGGRKEGMVTVLLGTANEGVLEEGVLVDMVELLDAAWLL